MQDREDESSYRPGVGMMLINKSNKIFVGQRKKSRKPAWQMPQGGIDLDEDPESAMLRELEEEIGTRNVEIITYSKRWYSYKIPPRLAPRLWGGKYKGQKQLWYLLRFLGHDKDINIATSHAEFSSWKWVEKQELLDLIIPFKRDLYREVLKDLWPYV